jgi:hypothetical protein
MGFLRRLLGKEESGPTDAFGRPLAAEETGLERSRSSGSSIDVGFEVESGAREPGARVISWESEPMETSWSSVWINGVQVPPEQARAFQAALDEVKGSGGIDVTETIDLSAIPGLGNELRQVMGLHAHDPAAMQRAVVEVLRRHNLNLPLPAGGTPASPAPPPTPWDSPRSEAAPPERTPAERLLKLDELRDRGVLTDAEFEQQRRRILADQ